MTLHYVGKKNGRRVARYRCTTTFQRGWHECPIKEVNADFDTLFAVANAAEREELLQLLIKRIVFRGHDAEVTMELFSSVNLHSEGSKIRASWLPSGASSKNFEFEFVLDLDAFRNRKCPRELKLPPIVGHLQMADEFQRLLVTGAAPNRAGLARQHGLTRARVTQLLDLLKLDPTLLDYVRKLPAGTPERLVTEKGLRRLVRLPTSVQLREAERIVPGFAAGRTTATG